MSRKPGESFATLARLKGLEEQVAAEQLSAARARLDHERHNLATVERYLADYALTTRGDRSPSRLLAEAQRFRLRLEQSVDAQRRAVALAEHQAEAARARWAAVRAEREALNRLAERRRSERVRRAGEGEQRQADELALRQAGKGGASGPRS